MFVRDPNICCIQDSILRPSYNFAPNFSSLGPNSILGPNVFTTLTILGLILSVTLLSETNMSTTHSDFLDTVLEDNSTPSPSDNSVLTPHNDESSYGIPDSIEFDVDDVSLFADTVTLTGREKVRSCVITIFPPDMNKKWLLPQTYFTDTTALVGWCGQFESCSKTQTLHAHIYAEWDNKKPQRFSTLRKIIFDKVGKPGDIAKTRQLSTKARGCAANYVLKPDTWISGDDTRYIWPHNKVELKFDQQLYNERRSNKSHKKSKEDLDVERIEYIETKPRWWTWDQIVHENKTSKILLATCGWGKKYHEGRHAETPRRNIEHVIILYGAGGTGKTTFAHSWDIRDDEDKQERYYRRNADDGAFWGGGRTAYKGQRIIHLEEFCGQESLSRFKEIADIGKPGPPVNVKNGGQELNHNTLIITSNHHPAAWFRKAWEADPKQFHPFWRRISQIWFFPPHKEDGSLNMPDKSCPPHYIDQTDDWKSLTGDYASCQNHASEHWPLKELSSDYYPGMNDFDQTPKRTFDDMDRYVRTGKHPKLN